MDKLPLLSLCIPTNGVIEWVIPVLDSIYAQMIDDELFEVIITDNGDNTTFQTEMKRYACVHTNFIYKHTDAALFLNEIEAYKLASGKLIKFVNHRTMLIGDSVNKLIMFAERYEDEKPIIYFSNGVLALNEAVTEYDTFDRFVRALSYWSSWSTGMTIWKSDFDKIPENTVYNDLFPHTTILFMERNRGKYIINNEIIMKEIPTGHAAKGKYDIFYAFGIEYPGIICDLLRARAIDSKTCKCVLKDNLKFIVSLFWKFCVKKEKCSYDLNGLNRMLEIFYKKNEFLFKTMLYPVFALAVKTKAFIINKKEIKV